MNHLLLFASGSYHANGLSIAAACSGLAILIVAVAVVSRARSTGAIVPFAITVGTCSIWLGSFAMMYASETASVAMFWARIGDIAVALVAPGMFHFAAVYVGREREYRRHIVWGWLVCAAMSAASVLPILVPRVHRYAWGFYPRATMLSGIAILFFIGVVAGGIALLRDSYAVAEGKPRERAAALMVAFAVVSLTGVDFLPAIGVDLMPISHIVVLAFVIIAATAVWRFHLVDLTPAFAASQILETMKGAVLVVDMSGRIRVVNATACAMLGYSVYEMVGMHVKRILGGTDQSTGPRYLKSSGVLEQATVWIGADGRPVDVLASSSLVRDEHGAAVGAVYVATDYTQLKRAEQTIRASELRYRNLFEGNPLPMFIYDFDTLRFTDVNDAAVAHYGYTRAEFLNMSIVEIRPSEDVEAVLDEMQLLQARHGPRLYRHRKKDGSVFNVDVTSFAFAEKDRRLRLVIAQDVTERTRNEEILRRNEERYRLLFERNLAGVYRTTLEGRILDCNDALARMFGYASRDELLAETAMSVYFEGDERHRIVQMLREQKTLSNMEVRMRRRDGAPVWVLENVSLLEGDILEGTLIDITDRKTAQERMEFQAYHDVLTGLPNRRLFRDRITVALAHAVRHDRGVAVMFLDLDQFKLVNDTLGHTVGDGLLQVVAARLVSCMRAEDTVARMGGDEFTILMSDITDRRAAATVAQKVIETIRLPFHVEGHELFVTSSIGIAMFPDDGADAETLLKNADRAMYRAKDVGRNNYQYATPASHDGAEGRLELERALHHALDRSEFVLHYQPVVEIATGRVVAAEALVRWQHPQNGLLHPDQFVGVAEQCNLIVPLGQWVLRTACAQMKKWHERGHLSLRIAVNLSARQLQHRDLVSTVERALGETGLPAAALDIEITESTAMQNVELSVTVLSWLRDMGVKISIDDFGKGYSSLSYLKKLPIDTVKIDQDFVRDLATDNGDAAIISAVISIARALNLNVIAEGVETPEQLAFLRDQQCELVQGYLHSRPLPADVFERELLSGRLRPPMDQPRLTP